MRTLADMSLEELQTEFGEGTPADNSETSSLPTEPQTQIVNEPTAVRTLNELSPEELAKNLGMSAQHVQNMIDPTTDEARPAFADGSSERSPINKSPIDVMDRFKLGFGNERGKINYLKERFDSVSADKTGALIVKEDNLWYRVDPSGLGAGNAWDKTKELVKDMADIGDIGSEVGGALGGESGLALAGAKGGMAIGGPPGAIVGAVGGFVAGSVGGLALAKKLNTSMGRYFGTYEDTPENELKNLGIESIFNVGGAFIPAGLQVGGKGVSQLLKKVAPDFLRIPDGVKNLYSSVIGAVTNTGADNVRYLLDNPNQVSAVIGKYGSGAAGAEAIKTQALKETAQLATNTRSALTGYYKDGLTKIASEMPTGFVAPVKESIAGVGDVLVQKNYATIEKGGFIKLRPRKEIINNQQMLGSVDEFATSDDAYKMLKDYTRELNLHRGMSAKSGTEAANQIVSMDQKLGDLAFRYKTQALDKNMQGARSLFTELDVALDQSISKNMATSLGKGSKFSDDYVRLRNDYKIMSTDLKPILKAQQQAIKSGSLQPYETLYNKFSAAGSAQATTKDAFHQAVTKLGSKNQKIMQNSKNIKLYSVATKFTPNMREGIVGFGIAGGVSAAVATGNPAVLTGVTATAAVTSPRLMGAATEGLGAAGPTAVKAMRNFSNFLRTLPPDKLKQLMSNETAMRSLLLTTTNSMDIGPTVDAILQSTGI